MRHFGKGTGEVPSKNSKPGGRSNQMQLFLISCYITEHVCINLMSAAIRTKNACCFTGCFVNWDSSLPFRPGIKQGFICQERWNFIECLCVFVCGNVLCTSAVSLGGCGDEVAQVFMVLIPLGQTNVPHMVMCLTALHLVTISCTLSVKTF